MIGFMIPALNLRKSKYENNCDVDMKSTKSFWGNNKDFNFLNNQSCDYWVISSYLILSRIGVWAARSGPMIDCGGQFVFPPGVHMSADNPSENIFS